MGAKVWTEADITPAMMDAGMRAYNDYDSRVEDPEGRAIRVFLAMAAAAGPAFLPHADPGYRDPAPARSD